MFHFHIGSVDQNEQLHQRNDKNHGQHHSVSPDLYEFFLQYEKYGSHRYIANFSQAGL